MKTEVRLTLTGVTLFLVAFFLMVPFSLAQGPWPEKAQDLKVLPADTSAQQLRQIMTGFTASLGVRCEHCHVGEAGASLETFDFVSESNPNKNATRAMMLMVSAINETHLKPAGLSEADCATCHRGQPTPPRPLGEVLAEEVESHGIDAAVETYSRLKAEHYGGIAYDFRAASLNGLAQSLFQAGKQPEALKIASLNVESNPSSVDALLLLGQIQMRTGDNEGARATLARAAELDPENRRIQGLLRRLQNQ